ncbi:hypothetical protein N9948_01240 [bacterium]|nr:hypothetical protein [bacterium]
MALPNKGTLPIINTFFVDQDKIALYWKASPKSNIGKWNVYGTPAVSIDFMLPNKGAALDGGLTPANAFVLLKEGIANRDTPLTPGSVYVEFTRAELGIAPGDPFYFAITSVEKKTSTESALEVPNIHAVPYSDDYFVDEAGQPSNVVYKSFEFPIWPTSGWDVDRYLDIVSLLGRPAKQIKMDAVGDNFWVRFNSFNSDSVSVRHSSEGFELLRGELQVCRLWLHNPTTNDVTIRIFVAG